MDKRVGVGIFLTNGRNVCLGLRSDGTYAIPGGKVEPGETPLQAAERELIEETGVAIHPSWFTQRETIESPGRDDLIWETWHYQAEYEGSFEVKEPDKFTKIGWYPIDRLPSPLFTPLKEFIERYSICLPN